MLKRILFAVSILMLGFVIVVGFVNFQLGVISKSISQLGDVVLPLSRTGVEARSHTRQTMLFINDAVLADGDLKRDEAREATVGALNSLEKDLAKLSSAKFKSLHQLTLSVPQEADDTGAAVKDRVETVIELLGELSTEGEKIKTLALATIDSVQKQDANSKELHEAHIELSRVYRASTALAALDATAFNTLTRSVMMMMYSRSLGETTIGRSKYAESVKLLKKKNPTPEQEASLAELTAIFEKTDRLLATSIANSDDYSLFVKSAKVLLTRVDALCNFGDEFFEKGHESLKSKVSGIVNTALAISIVAMLLGLTVTVLMAKSMIRPLTLATELVSRVARNDLTAQVVVTTTDEAGQIGAALNEMVDNLRSTVRSLHDDSFSLTAAATELSRISEQVTANSAQTHGQAARVGESAEQVTNDVHSVAAAVEEMDASMMEISRNANQATLVASRAAQAAKATNATVAQLGESSAQISDVINVIMGIAAQTNLLALNATIEAARAGEAGRGFAVVAQEVKDLAQQTSKATEEIGVRIAAIQNDTDSAVKAILSIGETIQEIDMLQSVIAGAVTEQSAAIGEISRNLSTATVATQQISSNIGQVATAARDTTSGATETAVTAESLARIAAGLRTVVERFTLPS